MKLKSVSIINDLIFEVFTEDVNSVHVGLISCSLVDKYRL
jgi:hypothetical protein